MQYGTRDVYSVDINNNYSIASESILFINLNVGNNLISLNVLPENKSIENIFSGLGDNIESIFGSGSSSYNHHQLGWIGSLNDIDSFEGYWLQMASEDVLIVVGEPIDRYAIYNLNAGPNLVSYPFIYSTGIDEAFINDNCEINGLFRSVNNFRITVPPLIAQPD